MKMTSRDQHGFAAIAAIFLVVILAALGGFMVTFSNTQQLTFAQDLQGSRAYWAARAGLGWGVAQVAADSTVCLSSSPAGISGAPATVEGFAITLLCSSSSYADSGGTVAIFKVEARATSGTAGTPNYVERSLSSYLEK